MNNIYIIGLSVCTFLLLILLVINLTYKKKKQINRAFVFFIVCLMICCTGQLASLLLSNRADIPPIYFDYFVYIGTCLLPVALWFFGYIFTKTKIQFKKKYLLLFVIPILSIPSNSSNIFPTSFSVLVSGAIYVSSFFISGVGNLFVSILPFGV